MQDDYKTKYQQKVKEALPKKGEAPVVGMRSNKNFITANAVEAILQGPLLSPILLSFAIVFPFPSHRAFSPSSQPYTPTRLSLFFPLWPAVPKPVPTGELNYLKKEDYGKVPEYLSKVRFYRSFLSSLGPYPAAGPPPRDVDSHAPLVVVLAPLSLCP